MKLTVKLENVDDELMFKRMNINISGKEIITPIKASYNANPVSSVNEIYKKFSLNKLNACIANEAYERKTNAEVKREMTSGINFFIVDYDDSVFPERKHIEMLSDIQYEHSDVVITPTFSKMMRQDDIVGEHLAETFVKLTNNYVEIVKSLNHKSIIGMIPLRMPRLFLEQIIKNYHNNDITSFVFDFDGRSVDTNSSWIRNAMRLLNSYDLFDKSLLYSVNANEGKFMKNSVEIPAKDFIGGGFGIDILGLNHIQPRMSSDAWDRIKAQRKENTYRIFNRDTYGYTKKSEGELLRLFDTSDKNKLTPYRKKYNVSEQHKETLTLQTKLKEEPTIESYIKSKSQIREDLIKKIKKLRSEMFSR